MLIPTSEKRKQTAKAIRPLSSTIHSTVFGYRTRISFLLLIAATPPEVLHLKHWANESLNSLPQRHRTGWCHQRSTRTRLLVDCATPLRTCFLKASTQRDFRPQSYTVAFIIRRNEISSRSCLTNLCLIMERSGCGHKVHHCRLRIKPKNQSRLTSRCI